MLNIFLNIIVNNLQLLLIVPLVILKTLFIDSTIVQQLRFQ